MRALEWLRHPDRKAVKPVYAVSGDDVYLRREVSNAIKEIVLGPGAEEMAVTRFEGNSVKLADVLDELRMLPFFGGRRLVFVEEADPSVSANRKELETYVGEPSRSGILVLMVKSWPGNTRLAQQVKTVGQELDCSAPGEKGLVPWLVEHAARHGAEMDTETARLLLELAGSEIGVLASGVEKLAVYVGESRKIRHADVTTMVEAGRMETVWKVIDDATTGQTASAVIDVNNLIAGGEHPIKILAALSSSLLKTHHAGRLRAGRLPLEEACRIAGIRDFGFEKTRRQHAHLGPARVDQLPAMMLQADLDLKGGSLLEPRVVLEQLLVRLALPRKD
jgi:DNA polymerase-3 subunit delta